MYYGRMGKNSYGSGDWDSGSSWGGKSGKGSSWGGKRGGDDGWTRPKGWGKGDRGDRGVASAVSGLTELMMWKEQKSWDEEEAKKKQEKELEERLRKEKEADDAKKEREQFREDIRKEQERFLKKMEKSTPEPMKGKRVKSDDGSGEEEEEQDWKEKLRKKKKAKKQIVAAPIEVDDWEDWEADASACKAIMKVFPNKTKAAELKGCGILEVAEYLEEAGVGNQEALRKLYKKHVEEEPKARWSKTDLLVGIAASLVSDE